MIAAAKLLHESIINNHLYPKLIAITPPIAGPTENPRFIARRMSETERVRFSAVLNAAIATELAGRNISAANAYRKITVIKAHIDLRGMMNNKIKPHAINEKSMVL